MAANIANTTAEVFQKEIVRFMNIDNVNILAKATIGENPSPVKPQPLLNIAIALSGWFNGRGWTCVSIRVFR